MAILLKELTIRYSPKGDTLFQLLKDYYAVFGLWQNVQTGDPVSQRKTEIVNDVMQQVGKMTYDRTLKRLGQMNLSGKEGINKILPKLNHAAVMEDWSEFTAALNDIARITSYNDRTGEFIKTWRDAKSTEVSPSLWGLFGGRPPKSTSVGKSDNKSLPLTPSTPKDIPAVSGQEELPPRPQEKLPQMQTDLPPLPTTPAEEPIQIGGNWEQLLNQFGYNWNEEDKSYKNDARNTEIQTFRNRSARVTLPSGKRKDFQNLGVLFRALGHNRAKRHGKEPVAQVNKENFVKLYEFLYT